MNEQQATDEFTACCTCLANTLAALPDGRPVDANSASYPRYLLGLVVAAWQQFAIDMAQQLSTDGVAQAGLADSWGTIAQQLGLDVAGWSATPLGGQPGHNRTEMTPL